MKKIKDFSFLILLLVFQTALSQSVEIYGKVTSSISVENIHVINKTAQVFTTTNKIGEFKITAKLNDTIIFSSIQHVPKQVRVNENVVSNQTMIVKLDEQINALDEVLVGKILTGDLLSDVENADDDAPINFFDIAKQNSCFSKSGDKIKFVPISIGEFYEVEEKIKQNTYQISKTLLDD
mgnify:CR=1 FL=1